MSSKPRVRLRPICCCSRELSKNCANSIRVTCASNAGFAGGHCIGCVQAARAGTAPSQWWRSKDARPPRRGVELMTVHCLGGRAMLEAARRGASEEGRPDERSSSSDSRACPKVLGVTLLTSLSNGDAREIGLRHDVAAGALALAELAQRAALDGIVCAPTEAQALRQRFGANFLLATPGVRPAGAPTQDQQRVLTPSEAIAQGADLLVIVRPITRAADPRAALDRICDEIGQ